MIQLYILSLGLNKLRYIKQKLKFVRLVKIIYFVCEW